MEPLIDYLSRWGEGKLRLGSWLLEMDTEQVAVISTPRDSKSYEKWDHREYFLLSPTSGMPVGANNVNVNKGEFLNAAKIEWMVGRLSKWAVIDYKEAMQYLFKRQLNAEQTLIQNILNEIDDFASETDRYV